MRVSMCGACGVTVVCTYGVHGVCVCVSEVCSAGVCVKCVLCVRCVGDGVLECMGWLFMLVPPPCFHCFFCFFSESSALPCSSISVP